MIMAIIIAFLVGALAQRYSVIGKTLLNIRHQFNSFQEDIKNAPIRSELTHIDLQIGYKNYQKIRHQREIAMNIGRAYRVHPYNQGYVSAEIKVNESVFPVKVSIKGGSSEHWAHPEKWSFKVKVQNGGTIMGMSRFALQHPLVRFFMHDWFFHRLLSFSDLIGLRLEFVSFSVNGENYGLYLIEENMGKELIEFNERREGVILQFSQDINWGYSEKFSDSGIPDWFYGTTIQPYCANRIMSDSTLRNQFEQAQRLLEAYRRGTARGRDIFDMILMARFFALIDLVGHKHSVALSNIKFYYNPVTGLLEPIGYDCGSFHDIYDSCAYWCPKGPLGMFQQFSSGKSISDDVFEKNWTNGLFSDREFYEIYIREIGKVSSINFLSELFSELDSAYNRNITIIQSQFPDYKCNIEEIVSQNGRHLRELLNPLKCIGAWLNVVDTAKRHIYLDLVNFHPLPVSICGLVIGENMLECISDSVLGPQVSSHRPAEPVRVCFKISTDLCITDSLVSEMNLVSHVFGTEDVCFEKVNSWRYSDGKDIAIPLPVSLSDSIPEFVVVDEDSREIRILPGVHKLKKTLEIPRGYVVHCGTGTSINMVDSAGIVSFSPLNFVATKTYGIKISSSDSTGTGVVVINANGKTSFEGVSFSGLTSYNGPSRFLTGAVSVYNSDVLFDQCEFVNISSEDALNIVNSDFSLTRSVFRKSISDALDVDFGTGVVSQCSFLGIGGDGLDFSGSRISVDKVTVLKAGDKGISVGEKSNVKIKNTSVCSTSIGVASKDLSNVKIFDIYIAETDTGFAAYQKKSEYGGGNITAGSVEMKNVNLKSYHDGQSVIIER